MEYLAQLLRAEYLARVLQIVFIDILLAGDNAVVIALAVRSLPARQQFLGRIWGTAGAVGLRLAFIAVVTTLLKVPLLQFVGALLLVWIAYKLVKPQGEEGGEGHIRHGSSLKEAIWIIIVADATMSLDNVIAIAGAAHGDMGLVAFGIALSIPLVVWGSGLLARLMSRHPWIVWVGGGVLGWVAGSMMFDDHFVQGQIGALAGRLRVPVGLGLAAVLTALGWWMARAPSGHAHEKA